MQRQAAADGDEYHRYHTIYYVVVDERERRPFCLLHVYISASFSTLKLTLVASATEWLVTRRDDDNSDGSSFFFGTLAGRPPPTNKSQAIPLLGTLWYHHCTIPPTISLATRYHIIPYHSYPPICTMPTDAACSLPLGSCCMGIPIKLHYTFLLLLVAQIFFAVRQYENFSYTLLIFVLYG